jgi:hypothetical protein
MEALREIALEAYDRFVGLELFRHGGRLLYHKGLLRW